MATSSKITADFTSDTSGMQKGVANIAGMFNKLTKTSAKTQKALSRMSSGISFLAFDRMAQYALSAGRALKSLVTNTVSSIDALGKLSISTGLTEENLQALFYAAEKTGTSQVTLSSALGRMNKRLAEASQGFGEALPALERMGLSIEDLMKKSPDQQFQAIAEAIALLPTAGERAAAAFKIFSDQGLQMLPMIEQMAIDSEKFRKELEAFGGILTEDQVQSATRLNDAMTDVYTIFKSITKQVAANLSPAISGMLETFTEFVSKVGGANIGKSISEGVLDAVQFAARIADWIISGFQDVFKMFGDQSTIWEKITFTWHLAWELAGRVAKLLAGLAEILIGGFKIVVSGFFKVVEKIVEVISLLPESIVGDLSGIKKLSGDLSKDFWDGGQESLGNGIDSLMDAFDADSPKWDGGSGPLETSFQDWRNSKPLEQEKTPEVNLSNESKKALSGNKLYGLDARSQAGMNFLLESRTPGAQTAEEKTAKNTDKIATNTSRPPITVVQMGIA